MNLDHALNQVSGELVQILDSHPGDQFCYPSAIVVVKRDHPYHQYVAWRAVDSSRDGRPAHFQSGNYCETLEAALNDSRKA